MSHADYHWEPVRVLILSGSDTSSISVCSFEMDQAEYCSIFMPNIRGEATLQGRLCSGSHWYTAYCEGGQPIRIAPNTVRLVKVPYAENYRFVTSKLQFEDLEIVAIGVYQVVVTALPSRHP